MATPGETTLWTFATKVYAETGIRELCLQLQDRQCANVLLLLWCAWLESRSTMVDEATFRQARSRVESTSELYIVPLREVRRALKEECTLDDEVVERVRSDIQRAELELEKRLLWELENHFTQKSTTSNAGIPALEVLVHLYSLNSSEQWLPVLRKAAARVARAS